MSWNQGVGRGWLGWGSSGSCGSRGIKVEGKLEANDLCEGEGENEMTRVNVEGKVMKGYLLCLGLTFAVTARQILQILLEFSRGDWMEETDRQPKVTFLPFQAVFHRQICDSQR